MNLNRRLEPLPELDLDLPERHEIFLLAAVLIVGLTFVTPALSLVLGVPALVFVAVVGAIYGVLAILFRRLLVGSLVALMVTSTFMANVPLASTAVLSSFPGHLGPILWLAQIPLVASIALVLLTEPRELLAGATKADGLFAVFVGWTVISALFGATARVDTALYFSLLMAQGLAVFVLFRYAVQRELLSFGLVARVFVGIVLAQSLFAVGQFFNRGLFGVTTLGEYTRQPIASISLGPFGEFAAGTYVAGFTGMSFILASLIILAVPLAVTMAVRKSGWVRATLLGAVLVMIAVMRATGTDAGRGGLIMTVVCLCAVLVYLNRTVLRNWIKNRFSMASTRVTNAAMAALTVLAGIAALFYPSSASGRGSFTTEIGGSTTGGSSGSAASGGGSAASNGASGAANTQPEAVESLLQNLSIPFFDISSFGIRLQQYVAGIDLFLQFPLFGIGGANFVYYSTGYGISEPLPLHNMYIALLAETGIPGFILFIALLVTVLWYGRKIIKHTSDGLLFVGLLCGIVGWSAFAFWDIPTIKVTTMLPFWALAGAAVGIYSNQMNLENTF